MGNTLESCKIDRRSANDVTIAVVVVGHNPGGYVVDLMESLMNQVDPPDEIIYYDDGSSDGSLAIIDFYAPRLHNFILIRGREKVGISAARNRANAAVKSEYIAVLDSDDFFLIDTIAKYRKSLRKNPTIDLIYADTIVFKDGHQAERGLRMRYPKIAKSANVPWGLMARPVVPFKHSSVIYRKEAFEKIGGYNETLPFKVDFDLLVRFFKGETVIMKLDSATSHHRTHHGQISKDRIHGILLYWKVIDWHEKRFFYCWSFKLLKTLSELAKLALGR